ncbi:putative mitochondrial protein [Tanacetum coccineum]
MILNGAFRRNLQVATIVNKMREGRLRWFGNVKRRPQSAPVRRVETIAVDGVRRRGRPKLRWEDRLKTNLKELLLTKDMTSDRNSWRTRIRVDKEAMASNKDRIENLEAALGQLQDGIAEMKISFADKFQHLEDIVTKSGNEDHTEWFTKVDQFFKNQGTTLWSRFGPTDCEDFDKALSKVQQMGPFREYQKEFERLGNRVRGWTQKALVGTFMGGLKPEIVDGIRMFKPTNLKDATSFARMRDEKLNRLSPITQASSAGPTKNTTMKRLTWDKMQKKRAQGLCFNCNEKFCVGYKCKGPQLLVMECALDEGDYESFIYQREH